MGGSESKQQFRAKVLMLHERDVPASETSFWSGLWTLPQTTDDVFSNVTPSDIREIRTQRGQNLVTLLEELLNRMSTTLHKDVLHPDDIAATTNCVRLLTRILPFLFEDAAFTQRVFWGEKEEEDLPPPPPPPAVSGEEEIEEETDEPPPPYSDAMASTEALPVPAGEGLAKRLLHTLAKLLFLPAYTLSPSAKKEGEGETGLLWEAGLGASNVVRIGGQVDVRRMEALRCLLVCFSESLLVSADEYKVWNNRWLQIACAPDFPHAHALFVSLLNVVLGYDPTGWIPYSSILHSDMREDLVDLAAQVLLVLLDYHHPTCRHTAETLTVTSKADEPNAPTQPRPEGETEPESPEQPLESTSGKSVSNIFRHFLCQLKTKSDFQFIVQGLVGLLNNPADSENTFLPGSLKQIRCYQELLILLWKLVDENKAFLEYVLTRCDVTQIVVPLLYFIYEGREDPTKVGVIHICTFVLLLLSGEREMGVALNKTFNNELPIDLPSFTGNHGDLLILVFHKLIVRKEAPEKLQSLFNCILTIIDNVSPYLKSLSMIASVKLLNLFELFSSPKFLYAAEHHHHYLFFLLETFNNLIQYQCEGNTRLVYAILRRKELFERLAKLPANQHEEQHPEKKEETEPPSEGGPPQTPHRVNLSASSVPRHIEEDGEHRRFVATPEWIRTWKQQMPLQTIRRLLDTVLPKVEGLCTETEVNDESQVVNFLQTTTLVGLLPVPHAILIRKYQPNEYTSLWFTTYIWGVAFLRNQTPPLFDGKQIKLFTTGQVP